MATKWFDMPTIALLSAEVWTRLGEGFDFLGYRFQQTRAKRIRRWAGKKAVSKLRDRVRPITRRTNGHSLESIIDQLNRILRGWFEYFKQSRASSLQTQDKWVRNRLRSVLKGRQKRRGIAKGWDNARWPNRYFAKHGLYSLMQAQADAR
tara:strand:+ start:34 stop:483 length:450 start_codon:yes stop_codon:yes gene_type:complete